MRFAAVAAVLAAVVAPAVQARVIAHGSDSGDRARTIAAGQAFAPDRARFRVTGTEGEEVAYAWSALCYRNNQMFRRRLKEYDSARIPFTRKFPLPKWRGICVFGAEVNLVGSGHVDVSVSAHSAHR